MNGMFGIGEQRVAFIAALIISYKEDNDSARADLPNYPSA
jgi:hypothetical protein